MRTILLIIILGFVIYKNMSGQTNPRFHFVAPAATIASNFPGHTNAIGMSMPSGYDVVEITAANQATFLSIAPVRIKYVYEQMQPGTNLRNRLNDVYLISGDSVKVNYFLVDDRTGISGASGDFLKVPFTGSGLDGLFHVWPSAFGRSTGPNTFEGRVRLGEYQMEVDQSHRAGGVLALQELVLHETSHTQLVDRWTKWNGYITYGANGGHTINEILGDQESALNEGMGTFYGYTINTAGAAGLINFFTRTDHRYVLEGQSVSAGYPQLYRVAGRQRRTIGSVTVFDYRWLDVPGIFNFYNENNNTAFLYYYWQYAYGSTDRAMSMINFAANAMWKDTLKRYPSFIVSRLALKMEEYNASAAGQSDATKTSSMFPFAMLDLVSHFSMTDAEYRENYERSSRNNHPRAYTEYFNHRNAIKQLVQADINATPITFNNAAQKIRTYCQQPATIF